jgi:hypothetical protein
MIALLIIALLSSSRTPTTTVNAFSPPQPLHNKAQLHTVSAAAWWRCEKTTASSTSTTAGIRTTLSSFSLTLLNLSSNPENIQDEEAQQAAAQQAAERARIQAAAAMNEKPPPRPMDPLVRSLTRMDDEAMSKNAPTTKIPLFGEVALDRSLFLFVPAAIFAVLGFVMSITVIMNSGDAIVNSLASTATTTTTDSTTTPAPSRSDCRGICSSQEQDLEGLRNFMTNFRK